MRLEPAENALVDASRRIGSLCRRQGIAEAQMLLIAESNSSRIAEIFMLAARTKALAPGQAMSIPVDLEKCRASLPDALDHALMNLLVLFTIRSHTEPTVDSGGFAMGLALQSSELFLQRGRGMLASETLRVAGRIMENNGLLREADRLFIKSESIITATAKWSIAKVGRLLMSVSSGYGYAPMRLGGAAVLLVTVVAISAVIWLHFPYLTAISLAIGDYFTLGGAKEYFSLHRPERILFSAEAAGALLINGFFLTLLTKRLFRS